MTEGRDVERRGRRRYNVLLRTTTEIFDGLDRRWETLLERRTLGVLLVLGYPLFARTSHAPVILGRYSVFYAVLLALHLGVASLAALAVVSYFFAPPAPLRSAAGSWAPLETGFPRVPWPRPRRLGARDDTCGA